MNNFDGFLNINKFKGLTSHDVVYKARKALRIKRIGHTGTLDPDAEGVLLLCIGRATRISSFLNELEKSYTATLELGSRTDTQDAGGSILKTAPVPPLTYEETEECLKSFLGESTQIPPMFSAIKKNGIPLYVLARQGKTVKRAAREINIYSAELLSLSTPFLTFKVTCSSGTYIRTLCEDLAVKLNTLGHLHKLTRTCIGNFSLENSITLEELKENARDLKDFLIPMEEALPHYPVAIIHDEGICKALNGMPVPPAHIISISSPTNQQENFETPQWVRLFTQDKRFFGIGERTQTEDYPNGVILIKKVLVDSEKFPAVRLASPPPQ